MIRCWAKWGGTHCLTHCLTQVYNRQPENIDCGGSCHCSKSCMIDHMTAPTTGKVVKYMSRQDWSQQTNETVYPPLFFPTLRMRKNSVPPTLFPHLTDEEKQCTPHSFSPPYRWGERVDYTLFPLQYGGNLKVYPSLFFPIVIRWRKRVYPLHSFSPS